jgi:hypothetical protein
MNTELTQITPNPLVPFGLNPMDAFGGEEDLIIKPTRMELVQPINAGENATPGMYRDIQSNDQRSSLFVVPILFQVGRVLFPVSDGESGSNKPICRSRNGLVPENGDGLTPQASKCSECSLGQWKKVGGKDIKPACSKTVSLLFVDREYGMPYRMTFKRTNYKAASDLMETIKKVMAMSRAKGAMLFPFQLEVKMSSTFINKGTRKYYVTNFGAPRPINDTNEVITGYAEIFKNFATSKVLQEDDDPSVDEVLESTFVDA